MADRFSDQQINQLKEALEPMFTAIQGDLLKATEERSKDRAESKEFREETNGHFESLEKRFQVQQSSIDTHSERFGLLSNKSA